MKKHRTLIIGLDGATFDLIHPWVQAGRLPTFAKLMAQGVHAPLLAWPNLSSATAPLLGVRSSPAITLDNMVSSILLMRFPKLEHNGTLARQQIARKILSGVF